MIMHDSKKMAGAILDKGFGLGAADSDVQDSPDEGLMAAAEDAMAAVEAKDPVAFKDALKSFFDQCDSAPDEAEDESGEY